MDIVKPIVLDCPFALHEIVDRRGRTTAGAYHLTPLDFVDRGEWTVSRTWQYEVKILQKMRIVHRYKPCRPITNISSFNFPPISPHMLLVMGSIWLDYILIFVAGWNFHYTTRAEQILWGVSTVGTLAIWVGGSLFKFFVLILEPMKGKRDAVSHLVPNPDIELLPRFQTTRIRPEDMAPPIRMQAMLQRLRNNSENKDPALDLPIGSLLISVPACFIYIVFRVCILVEDFYSLRQLSGSAFATLAWSTYLPHF
jgi:hypothetical protein